MNNRLKFTLIFFVATFVCTWSFYLSLVFLKLHPYEGVGFILLLFGGCAPTYVGFIMAMVTYKKSQKLNYLKRIYDVRLIKPVWWIILLLLMPAIITASIGLDYAFGGTIPAMSMLKSIIASPVLWFPCVLLSFMSGPFSEELGWRGFALDPLLERFGFTKASIVLGFIWGFWHLPLYFMPDTWHGKMGFQIAGFWSFIIMSIGLSMIMSLVYINTNRSILAAMLMHLSSNFSTQLIAGSSGPGYSPRIELFRSLLILIIGIAICIYMTKIKRNNASNYKLPVLS